jgi:hypothetical protein
LTQKSGSAGPRPLADGDDAEQAEDARSLGLRKRIDCLVQDFEHYVDIYDEREGDDPGHESTALRRHRETIELRTRAIGAASAVADEDFLQSLTGTLTSWRAFRPNRAATWREVKGAFVLVSEDLENLERYAIDDQNLPLDAVTAELWRVIDQVATKLDKRDSLLVLGSKALHHVLPELVPPMDRANTGWFLAWGPSAWTRSSAKVSFTRAMKVFHVIALGGEPRRLVTNERWRTSTSKLVDNAIGGFR